MKRMAKRAKVIRVRVKKKAMHPAMKAKPAGGGVPAAMKVAVASSQAVVPQSGGSVRASIDAAARTELLEVALDALEDAAVSICGLMQRRSHLEVLVER